LHFSLHMPSSCRHFLLLVRRSSDLFVFVVSLLFSPGESIQYTHSADTRACSDSRRRVHFFVSSSFISEGICRIGLFRRDFLTIEPPLIGVGILGNSMSIPPSIASSPP
jgi:hypothetical protein